jgi:hypothetical protein
MRYVQEEEEAGKRKRSCSPANPPLITTQSTLSTGKLTLAAKCSGTYPCAACTAKSFPCSFSNNPPPRNHSGDIDEDSSRLHRGPKAKSKSSATWQHRNTHITKVAETDVHLEDSAPEDETPIQAPGRLLQDGGGRLCEHENLIYQQASLYIVD